MLQAINGSWESLVGEWKESRENAEGSPKFNSCLVRDLVCKAGGERR